MQETDKRATMVLCRWALRHVRTALIASVIPALSVLAQNQKNSTSAAAPSVQHVVVGHAFGDTAHHAVRVLEFDAKSETARVYASSPQNMLVIAVVPGREIEVIYPGDMMLAKGNDNTYAFHMQRFELSTVVAAVSTSERQAFERCQRDRAARMRQNEINSRSRKDSAGRSVSAGAAAVSDYFVDSCDMPTGETKGSRLVRKQLPARADAERYLMVLTSTARVTLADLETRLAGLTAVAPDVGLTIEAIAAGIFAGRSGTYGGTWVAW